MPSCGAFLPFRTQPYPPAKRGRGASSRALSIFDPIHPRSPGLCDTRECGAARRHPQVSAETFAAADVALKALPVHVWPTAAPAAAPATPRQQLPARRFTTRLRAVDAATPRPPLTLLRLCAPLTPQLPRRRCAAAAMGNLVSFSAPRSEATNYHQLSALDIDKQSVDFSSLAGKVVLVVNVASK